MLPIILTLLACTGAPTSPQVVVAPRDAVAPAAPAPAYAFARHAGEAALTLPATTRPGGAEAPVRFHPVAPFEVARKDGAYKAWATPLPVDFHLFMQRQAGARTFGYYEPEGITVTVNGERLPFEKWGRRPGSWGYDTDRLYVGTAPDGTAPDPASIEVTWAKATARERTLHLATSDLAPAAFAVRTVQLGTTSHHGLLLPAPAEASWEVTVPGGGVIATRSRILPPAIRAPETSDGAVLRIHVTVGGRSHLVSTTPVAEDWTPVRADLSAWAGETATVRFEVDPGPTSTLDLVFLEDPTLYTPKTHPARVIVAFIDTVRADHLGMYGYARDTTPKLDVWSADATRFEQHRTVAPWTLPSALSAMTGDQPERFAATPTLADQLAEAGFHTRGIVANAYLSQVFGVHRGFAHYDYNILQPAHVTVDQALDTLSQWPDRDVMLLVQFMEAHLPYQEPPAYRDLFTGDKPDALPAVSRNELVKFSGNEPDFQEVYDYVTGRYDQNIRVLDDQVSRLFDAAGPQATTVLFADHGEEFWDHKGFEHGQSLHDELLRVPFVVRTAAMASGVVTAPTSLLDLTPTVLEAVGLQPPTHLPGRSLVPLANGQAEALAAFTERPQGVGRLLYGPDGWGVVAQGHKWVSRDGREHLWDLAADPTEQSSIAARADRSAYPGELAQALGREVPLVWRVTVRQRGNRKDVTLTARHPDGFAAAWKGYDPKGWFDASTVDLKGDAVVATQPAGERLSDTWYLQPKGDPLQGGDLTLTFDDGSGPGTTWTGKAVADTSDGSARVVLQGDGAWQPTIDLVYAPVPGGDEVSAYNEELSSALEQLGYVDPAK